VDQANSVACHAWSRLVHIRGNSAGAADYDISRLDIEAFGFTKAGGSNDRRGPSVSEDDAVLRQVYDQMMESKWPISMGVCASHRSTPSW
jgi:NADH:ubiquinone oxidoreductase subunit B-like Fe-S oxidoreductase